MLLPPAMPRRTQSGKAPKKKDPFPARGREGTVDISQAEARRAAGDHPSP